MKETRPLEKRRGKKPGLHRKITVMILACWMIPVLLLIFVMWFYMTGSHSAVLSANYRDQFDFNARLCVERLDRSVKASRQASYDGTILSVRSRVESGTLTTSEARKQYDSYLQSTYGQANDIAAAVLWFPGEEESSADAIYNERAGGTFSTVRHYWLRSHDRAASVSETLGTSVAFLQSEGSLLLIRNLVDSHYKTKAVLVLILNTPYVFESLIQYPSSAECAVFLNDMLCVPSTAAGNSFSTETGMSYEEMYSITEKDRFLWRKGRLFVSDILSGDSYTLKMAAVMKTDVTQSPFFGYRFIMVGMIVGMTVLLLVMRRTFRREVQEPIAKISKAAAQIEEGQLGTQIKSEAGTEEFIYITDAFNQMSRNLKGQFDRIYEEEVALREARIKALQSSINPHFLNNTLEIINWESMLAGNDKVSRMIDALSTMLDAALDRHLLPMVPLSEEMHYVSAYLYIMSERFGDRLKVDIDIPKELETGLVPRLILQPVMENAIEHGAVINGSGRVLLSGECKEERLILKVSNDGDLTNEDQDNIARLLSPDYNPSRDTSGNIGIANVNQRLKMLFGDQSGLTITREGQWTVSVLSMPYRTS